MTEMISAENEWDTNKEIYETEANDNASRNHLSPAQWNLNVRMKVRVSDWTSEITRNQLIKTSSNKG